MSNKVRNGGWIQDGSENVFSNFQNDNFFGVQIQNGG
jgi:hypothetical protein